jgi:hypothetical protein
MITHPGAPNGGSASTAPAPARFADERRPHFDGPTLTDIRHAIEAQFPGWHVWLSDSGHTYAVRSCGHTPGVTLTPPAIGLVSHAIALFEHQERIAAERPTGGQAHLAANRMAAGLGVA